MKFLPTLMLLFIALKLTGVINWSWWLVLSPFLIPLLLVPILMIFLGVLKYLKVKNDD